MHFCTVWKILHRGRQSTKNFAGTVYTFGVEVPVHMVPLNCVVVLSKDDWSQRNNLFCHGRLAVKQLSQPAAIMTFAMLQPATGNSQKQFNDFGMS